MSFFGGGKNKEAELARQDEEARQKRIREGTNRINSIFGQFDNNFFTKQQDAYLNYANPQLTDQYRDAEEELTFSLARSGLLNSGVRGEKTSELQKLFDLRQQEVRDQALSLTNQQRNAVEDARQGLITTLNATGDAKGASNAALTRASLLTQPQAYSPLGQLFADFTAGLGTQAAHERAAAASGGMYKPRYNTGLFGGAGRVTVS